jgi:soluble lytic murein transglycosylase-like protein
MAAGIVAAARADAERTLAAARETVARRERELVSRIESICSAPATADGAELLAAARVEAEACRATAARKARQVEAHAEREAQRIRVEADRAASELQRRADRRRARLDAEIRALVRRRDDAAREFADAISSLAAAAELIAVVQEEGGGKRFARRVRAPRRQRVVRRTALVLAPVVLLAAIGYVLVRSTPASALLHDDVRPTAVVTPRRAPLCPIPTAYREAFVSAARSQDVPLSLLVSVATVESRFDAKATSSAGAVGLLQLLPSTAGELQVDPTSPAANVLGGATYLRQLLDRFGDTTLALAAYNAGPTAVANGAIPTTTLTYVNRVLQTWSTIRGCR